MGMVSWYGIAFLAQRHKPSMPIPATQDLRQTRERHSLNSN